MGIHADEEALGVCLEQPFPGRRQRAVGRDVAAVGQFDHQVRVCLEQGAQRVGRHVETGVRPDHGQSRYLCGDPDDGVGVGVRVQEETALVGQLQEGLHHRCRRVGAEHVELADAAVREGREMRLDPGDQLRVGEPVAAVGVLTVRPQQRDDPVRGQRVQLLGPRGRCARHEGPGDAGTIEAGDRVFGWDHVPDVVVVMDVGLEQWPVARAGGGLGKHV